MHKLDSSLKNMFFSLTVICLVSAAILAFMNELTKKTIADVQKQKLEAAIKEVIPGFDNSPQEEMYEFPFSENDIALIYPAKKGGQLIGVAVETTSFNGFSGAVKVLTGITTDGIILNYQVLQHSETPGLGDKMSFWFKTEKNNQSVLGKNLKNTLKLKKDGGDIDAITAATISSRAFLDAVNKAYAAYMGSPDSNTGATSDSNSGASTSTNSETTPSSNSNSDANTGATTP